MHATPAGTQEATVGILRSLFPPWLPGAFAVMFSRPMPGLSCRVCWGSLGMPVITQQGWELGPRGFACRPLQGFVLLLDVVCCSKR